MSKVEIEKRGRIVKVHAKLADVLIARGGYIRRDMVAEPAAPKPAAEPKRRGRKSAQKPAAETDSPE